MNEPAGGAPTPRIVDEAIAWAVRVLYAAPDAQTRGAFERWLAADPRHGLAWRRVRGMADEFRGLPAGLAHDTLRTREALRQRRRKVAGGLGAALAAAGLSGWLACEYAPWQRLVADASTATGERRTLRLDDGSLVTLNTDSAISSRLSAQERRIDLLRGEIFVETGPDAGAPGRRPFVVATPQGRLQALGTRFVVRLDNGRTRVAVREGAVALQPDGGPTSVAGAGQEWSMDGAASRPAAPAGFEPAGWLDGVIVARKMPLADFLAELDRYRHGFLAADPRVAAQPVSGVYQLGDIDATLRFLARAQGLSLRYRTRYWITVAPGTA